jgi:O-antigen/teichoic acid export membrane protein
MTAPILRRLLRGFSANVFGQIVVVGIQVAAVPVLLHSWGPLLYGEWLILSAIPAYFAMADLGFSQSAGNEMAARVARGQYRDAVEVFQSVGLLVLIAGGTVFVVLSGLLLSLPDTLWSGFVAIGAAEARIVFWLLAAEVLFKLIEGPNHAGFRANGEYALHTLFYYITLLLQYACALTLAMKGCGPVVAAAGFLAVRVVSTTLVTALLTKRHSWLRWGLTNGSVSRLKGLLSPALANVSVPLAQALNVQGFVLIVGAVLGPMAVVTFSTLRTLSRFVLQLVMAVNHSAEPELASAYGSDNSNLLRRLFRGALRVGFWLALSGSVLLLWMGPYLLEIWTRGQVQFDAKLFYWLVASAFASVLWYGALTLLKAANRHLRASVLYVCAAGCAGGLAAALLAYTRDLSFAGLSLLFMDGVMAVFVLKEAARLFGSNAMSELRATISPLSLMGRDSSRKE